MACTNFCVVENLLYMEVNNSNKTWHVVICALNNNNTEKVSKIPGDPEALTCRTLTKCNTYIIDNKAQKLKLDFI